MAMRDENRLAFSRLAVHRKHRVVLVLSIGLAATAVLARVLWNNTNRPGPYIGPNLQEVVAIRACFPMDPSVLKMAEFDIPSDLWEQIFICLSQSTYEPSPRKWVVVGSLTIQFADGREQWIFILEISDGVNAFSVGPFGKRHRYYRIGSLNRLQKVITEAYARTRTPRDASRNE